MISWLRNLTDLAISFFTKSCVEVGYAKYRRAPPNGSGPITKKAWGWVINSQHRPMPSAKDRFSSGPHKFHFLGGTRGDPIYNENGPFLLLLDCCLAIAIVV